MDSWTHVLLSDETKINGFVSNDVMAEGLNILSSESLLSAPNAKQWRGVWSPYVTRQFLTAGDNASECHSKCWHS